MNRSISTRAATSFSLAGVRCSSHTIDQLVNEVTTWLESPLRADRTILCLNAHIFNLATRDDQLRQALNSTAIVAADGIAIVWAARLFGIRIPQRCNMTEAFRVFLDAHCSRSTRACVIGLSPAEGKRAAAAINAQSKHCNVVSTISGYLSDEEYANAFARLEDIDLVLLGMGSPKTERISRLASLCLGQHAVIWGIGGGSLRILAGTMSEAPLWWKRAGLQWLNRLLTEPGRLWKRYLIGNPLFVYRVICHRLLKRHHSQ